jgi:hypothetical protein
MYVCACVHTQCTVELLYLLMYSGTYNFVRGEQYGTVPSHISTVTAVTSTVTAVTHDLNVRHLHTMVDAGCHCQYLSAHNES